MKVLKNFILLLIGLTALTITGCKKDKAEGTVVDAIYITSNAITGTATGSSTTITNAASGKVSVSPVVARVYVNTLKTFDVTVNYSLSGTATAGTNYTVPNPASITIPAGKWYADIQIPVINTPVSGSKTIIISLTAASNNVQLGIGTDRNYKVFTYTLTN